MAHAASVPAGWLITGRLRPAGEPVEMAHAAVEQMVAHLRLGHLHHAGVRQAAKVVDGLELKPTKAGHNPFCVACALGKAKRPAFLTSPHRDSEPGRTLCFDLGGAPGDV